MLGEEPGATVLPVAVVGRRSVVGRADARERKPAESARPLFCAYSELIHVSAVRPGATALDASQHQSNQKQVDTVCARTA